MKNEAQSRKHQFLGNLDKAVNRLQEVALESAASEIEKDAAIQRFEIAVELTWKTLKKFLEDFGVIVNTPKDAFFHAFMKKWIRDEKIWLQMMRDRNLCSHVYNEELSRKVFARIKTYLPFFNQTVKTLKKL